MRTPQQRFNEVHKQAHDRFMARLREPHRPHEIGAQAGPSEPLPRAVGVAATVIVVLISLVVLGICGFIVTIAISIARVGLPF